VDDLESLITRLQSLIDAATGNLIDNLSPAQISEYHEVMEELLSRYHLAAYMVGAGTDVVSDKAREKILEGVANQLAFLQGFITEIEDNDTFEMGWQARARMYGESIKEPYWNGRVKLLPLPSVPGSGDTQCLTNCKCFLEVKNYNAEKGNADVYWRLSQVEHCQTCVQRATEWNPLKVRGNVLQTGEEVDVPPVPTPAKFVPAKTRAEAEAWARSNLLDPNSTKDVNYKGIDIDVANDINRTIYEQQQRGIPKVWSITTKSPKGAQWAARMSTSGELEINSSLMKSRAMVAEATRKAEAQFGEEGRRALRELQAARSRLDPRQLRMLRALEENLKYSRFTVGNDIEGLITHELGHRLDNAGYTITGESANSWFKRATNAVTEQSSPEYRYLLSAYAYSNPLMAREEVFAEAYTAYIIGDYDSLAPSMLSLFQEVIP